MLAPGPLSVSASPWNPNHTPTTAPAGSVTGVGGAAGTVSASMTSGRYTDSAPVAGLTIVASTKAAVSGFASWQPPPVSWYGVASPAAVVGAAGTRSMQSVPLAFSSWWRFAATDVCTLASCVSIVRACGVVADANGAVRIATAIAASAASGPVSRTGPGVLLTPSSVLVGIETFRANL